MENKVMKIGMIDYDLNEWHAETYPEFFRNWSDGKVEIAYVYAMVDGKEKTKQQWADEYGVKLCETIGELIELSDGIIVLSPDNPEFHPVLSEQALAAGKRLFIDKTFSTDYAAAKAMVDRGEKYNTPFYSASALCFADEYKPLVGKVDDIKSIGYPPYSNYSVHQIDPILTIMQEKAKYVWTDDGEEVKILFESGRTASFQMVQHGYTMDVISGDKKFSVPLEKDFWSNCIREMSRFFLTGELPVEHWQTLEAMAIREAGMKAKEHPGEKVYLEDIRG